MEHFQYVFEILNQNVPAGLLSVLYWNQTLNGRTSLTSGPIPQRTLCCGPVEDVTFKHLNVALSRNIGNFLKRQLPCSHTTYVL